VGSPRGGVGGWWVYAMISPQVRLRIVGVNIYGFLTIPEDAKIGVSAHEIGHLGKDLFHQKGWVSNRTVFGWPDLYDTDNTSWGVGDWCLMSYGNWGQGGDRPVHPGACMSETPRA
jgi:immune inhibitor A